ncbi:acetoacetate decarboxylase family protein [Streptacidiphilus sp. ASG 303]|uniref:acetoacetate decarboxylase family protein n=1 Tax=Streptacidiphilus sp. ASG 303 TaxID=2896847 RepID=UPI001E5E6D35|nr:acetoacetate decarboxylase family protein [Streptacidiphilus sp. ASG 303]MCD0484629.1 acetoacetate decarboxylase family protein [Streptacidiphilus sp. ASG 303]
MAGDAGGERRFPGVRVLVGTYEADGELVEPLLPAGVEPWDDPVRCAVWGLDFPFPGPPYRLAAVAVRVRFADELHHFFPVAYCSRSEEPEAGLVGAAGPRRRADIGMSAAAGQRILTVGGADGGRLITVTATPDRPASVDEFAGPPLLQVRGDPDIPHRGPAGPYRLVRTDLVIDGTALEAGPGLVTVDTFSELDPLLALEPVRMRDCFWGTVELRSARERTVHRATGGGQRPRPR